MELSEILTIILAVIVVVGAIAVFCKLIFFKPGLEDYWDTKVIDTEVEESKRQSDRPISATAIEGYGKLTWASSGERIADLPFQKPSVADGQMLVMILTAISKHYRLALNVSTPEIYLEAMKKLDSGIYFKADLYTLAEEHFDRCFGSDDNWETTDEL